MLRSAVIVIGGLLLLSSVLVSVARVTARTEEGVPPAIWRRSHVVLHHPVEANQGAAFANPPAEFPTDPATLIKHLEARDAQFDNRSIEVEQQWSERVSPLGIYNSIRHNTIRFGGPDPGLPSEIPDDFVQPHRLRHLLTIRGTDVTMENLGDLETIKDRRFVTEDKGRRRSAAGGYERVWSPEMKYLILGDAPGGGGGFFDRELWRLQWPCGYGVAKCIDSIESMRADGDRLIVKGRMALRRSYAPDDKTKGRDPFELQLDRDLIIRKASINFHVWRYEIETWGVLKSSDAPPIAEGTSFQLIDAEPGRREIVQEQYEFTTVAVSDPLTDEQYAERIRIDPSPETEIKSRHSAMRAQPRLNVLDIQDELAGRPVGEARP